MFLQKLFLKIKLLFVNFFKRDDKMLVVKNTSEQTIFTTEDRLFKLIGYVDVGYGNFTHTVNEQYTGNLYFIPVQLHNTYTKQPTAYGTSIPNLVHLSNVRIVNNTIQGNVTCLFNWNLPQDNSKYFRIFYGVI